MEERMIPNVVKNTIAIILLLNTGRLGFSQGFVNLNFEAARIVPLTEGANFPPYSVATTNALPGWAVYYGGTQQTQITYNDPAAGSTFVTLWATNGQNISGNYSVLLQGGLTDSAASISQTSLTPVTAEAILFKAQYSGPPGAGLLSVSMNGQNIPLLFISTGPNYTLYGGDISAFAGQTVQLTFSAPNLSHDNNWNIDDIQLSNLPVPEPSVFTLSALGALLVGWRVLGRRR
jgi:hypothetical protein